jgi:acyl transferase domain-containing protein
MPDAANADKFWQNIKDGRYSISEVPGDRWDADLYYDADPKAPDKTYTKIGGWVRDWEWDPLKWKLPIPPRVAAQMDLTQKWAIVATREALADYGYPERHFDPERTAVILGNAMGGDTHLMTSTRILFPEYASELSKSPSFAELPENIRKTIIEEMRERVGNHFPEITEDTMPGELSNIIAGRIAALFNFRGPNYVTDAACASAMAAISAAIEGLEENHYDAVITGGVDANMSPQTFVKFCKIGALSATGTRPFAEGADGFVMGEGAALFVVKRLEDAERDRDKIYAVVRALGGSSDGRGKGITAPNPIGQKLAIQRAWQTAGLTPSAGDMIEGHGTSTIVGDIAELESLTEAFADYNVPPGSVTLGSVKSNIGHLKGAAGAAGLLKATFSLYEKVLPPSLNFHRPNPNIDFEKSPFAVNTELKAWEVAENQVRRAGVSSFGFGGTNFHAVLEEYIPGRLDAERKARITVSEKTVPRLRAHRHRLRRRQGTGGQSRSSAQSVGTRPGGPVESPESEGDFSRSRSLAKGRVPLHRTGFPVCEHAARPQGDRADRGRDVCRSRRGHEAPSQQGADGVYLRRRIRPGSGGCCNARAQANGDHAAGRPCDRNGALACARGLRHRARHGHGTQPR